MSERSFEELASGDAKRPSWWRRWFRQGRRGRAFDSPEGRQTNPTLVFLDCCTVDLDGKRSPPWTMWKCECGRANGNRSRCKCGRIYNLKDARRALRSAQKEDA